VVGSADGEAVEGLDDADVEDDDDATVEGVICAMVEDAGVVFEVVA